MPHSDTTICALMNNFVLQILGDATQVSHSAYSIQKSMHEFGWTYMLELSAGRVLCMSIAFHSTNKCICHAAPGGGDKGFVWVVACTVHTYTQSGCMHHLKNMVSWE